MAKPRAAFSDELKPALRHAGKMAAGKLALMPAFTFAATAHAAQWAGLTPLLCDISPDAWSADAAAEEALLRRFGDRIAVLVPYTTFGAAIDLDRYAWLARQHGVAVVVDAASSLGTRDQGGGAFGAGAPFAVVHSMHATDGMLPTDDASRAGAFRFSRVIPN